MDLCEKTCNPQIHPWESARTKVLAGILKAHIELVPNLRILEVGCGDGYVLKELAKKFPSVQFSGIDIHFSLEQIEQLKEQAPGVSFVHSYEQIKDQAYDLILLFDVLEHIEEDQPFFKKLIDNHLAKDGQVFITVPAFQRLWSSHDLFLKHYRRYSPQSLRHLLKSAQVSVVSAWGFFFVSLALVRMLELAWSACLPKKPIERKGVGQWQGGCLLSTFLEKTLLLDAWLSLALCRLHIKIPGLSLWMICRKLA